MGLWMEVRAKAVINGRINPTEVFGKVTASYRPPVVKYKSIDDYYTAKEKQEKIWKDSLDDRFANPDNYIFAGSGGTPRMKWVKDSKRTTVWITGWIEGITDPAYFIDWFKSKLPESTVTAYAMGDFWPDKQTWTKE